MSVLSIRKSILGLGAAAALAAGGLFAGRLAAGPVFHHGPMSAEKIFNRIADRLDLSDTQQSEIKQILKSHENAIVTQIGAQTAARQALHQAVQLSPVDETTIRQRATDLGIVQGDGAVLMAQIRTEIWPVLNDEQKTKVAAFHVWTGQKVSGLATSVKQFLDSSN